MKKINLVIYGATGSIGSSVLSVVRKNKERFNIEGITCNTNYRKIKKISEEFNVKKIGVSNSIKSKKEIFIDNKLFIGIETFHQIISAKTDVVIIAISGSSIIDLVVKIIMSGKKIGIANKESIISLGKVLLRLADKYHSEIVPLDSEHNSIYHLNKLNIDTIDSVTLTASGGPFRGFTHDLLKKVKLNDALKHPVWKMGKKISIDSATMMNKALEIIEAKYLFNLDDNKINALIHPQSIIHALINYKNGSSTGLLSEPDMRIPIASLFFSFNSFTKKSKRLNLAKLSNLEFYDIDESIFPSIKLGRYVMSMEGLAPNAFNYLNDLLVKAFIEEKIKFTEITTLNEENLGKIFAKNSNIMNPSVDDIKNINNWIDNNLYLGKQ